MSAIRTPPKRFSIRPGNQVSLRERDEHGAVRHWILEIHFVDRARQIGGFTEELLTLGTIQGRGRLMFKRVMLCYDGTAAGRRALRRGAELAIQLQARVFVLSIVPSGVADPAIFAGAIGEASLVDEAGDFRRSLQESVRWLEERQLVAEGHLASGTVIEQILVFSKRLAIDLIVLGHYPQPSGGFWWSGSQRASLAEQAKCCIFVAVNDPDAPPPP